MPDASPYRGGPRKAQGESPPLREPMLSAVPMVVLSLLPILVGGFLAWDNFRADNALVGSLWGLAGAAATSALFHRTFGQISARKRVRERLRDRPEEVVWVFERVVSVNDTTHRSLVIGFVDGALEEWPLSAALVEQPLIRSWIARCFSHATLGTSPAREAQFRAAPHSLIRRPNDSEIP